MAGPRDAFARLARCCAIFGLTRGEAQVALGVMNSKSIEQIAATQGHSISTSRNLLKRAFAKTGVNPQSELTHLMLHSPLFLDPELFEPTSGGRLGVSRSN